MQAFCFLHLISSLLYLSTPLRDAAISLATPAKPACVDVYHVCVFRPAAPPDMTHLPRPQEHIKLYITMSDSRVKCHTDPFIIRTLALEFMWDVFSEEYLLVLHSDY